MKLPELRLGKGPVAGSEHDRKGWATWPWLGPNGERFGTAGSRGNERFIDFEGVARYHFTDVSKEVTAVPVPGIAPGAAEDLYQRQILPIVLQVSDYSVLHASAIATKTGVVAICGDSQAGKSTLAYALSQLGFDAWADDALALDVSKTSISALPLPFRFRLWPDALQHFGLGDSRRVGNATTTASTEDRERLQLPLRLVLVLDPASRSKPTDPGFDVSCLAPGDAFEALLRQAWCFNTKDEILIEQIVGDFLEISRQIPVWRTSFDRSLGVLSDRAKDLATTIQRSI